MGPMRLLQAITRRRVRPPAPSNHRPSDPKELARRRVLRSRIVRELAGAIGFALLLGGIAAFDWRAALLAAGVILQLASLVGALLDGRLNQRG